MEGGGVCEDDAKLKVKQTRPRQWDGRPTPRLVKSALSATLNKGCREAIRRCDFLAAIRVHIQKEADSCSICSGMPRGCRVICLDAAGLGGKNGRTNSGLALDFLCKKIPDGYPGY